MKKTLISITLTLSLIMSFALSAPPVQALPANSNVYIANLTEANIGNLENGTLIFGIFGKIAKTAAKTAKKTSKAVYKSAKKSTKSAKKTSKAASKSAKKTSKASSKTASASKTKGGSIKRSSSPVHKHRELRNTTIDNFKVDKSHLGTGTKTTAKTRQYVNNPNTRVPYKIQSSFKSGKESRRLSVDNPRSKRMDAGHSLGNQSGGKGHVNEHVFPQNPSINRDRKSVV